MEEKFNNSEILDAVRQLLLKNKNDKINYKKNKSRPELPPITENIIQEAENFLKK
ncbi:hypothetical protein OAM66_01645 [Pelagibacteraceae bacterium]|jgi:hypothetical protein|nr:hypothetical protein [Pelagibacteraceae bacterium]|tara:strand:- start:2022 stop:2186 length:165 start_codon:yes stop_codon:yes gene_type:complete